MSKSMVFYDQLMPYQKEAVNKCFDSLKLLFSSQSNVDNVRKFVISPTGSGKTYMSAGFIERAIFAKDNQELNTKIRVIYVTHSLTMANDFKEKFKKLELSVMTHEDIDQKVMKNSDILLINPEKINSKHGSLAIRQWKNQSTVPVILVMDEGDITHDGKRNQELLKIMQPIYQLAFSATFDINKDKKDAFAASRLPSDILVQISVYDVQKSGAIVKGHYVVPHTKGVSFDSVLKEAIKKLLELNILSKKLTANKIIPKMLIQTQASDSESKKNELIKVLKELDQDVFNVENEICIITGEKDESYTKDDSQVKYYIGDQKISRGWDNPEVYVLVVDKNSVDVRSGTQLLGRVCRIPYRTHYGDGFEDLNFGYVYVAGNHSIEKSAANYVAGVSLDINEKERKSHNVQEMETVFKRNIKTPKFISYIVEWDNLATEKKRDRVTEKTKNILVSIYKDLKKNNNKNERVSTALLLLVNENNLIDKKSLNNVLLEITEDYGISILEKTLGRRIPAMTVSDAIAAFVMDEEFKNDWKLYAEDMCLKIENDDNFKFFDLISQDIDFQIKDYIFPENKLVTQDSISFEHSLYEKDDMNKEELSFVQLFLEDFCKNNGYKWVRNRECRDVRLSLGYYPDFIVFNEESYFFIEYKGQHLQNSENSKKKIEYGLGFDSKIKSIMVIKDGKDSFIIKGKHKDEILNLDNLRTIIDI